MKLTAQAVEKKETRATKVIVKSLFPTFPTVEAYQYNSCVIRIRIIDSRFQGKSIVARENLVFPLIEKLPEDTQQRITMLLLLTPEEAEDPFRLSNIEFEHPSPSSL